jgi:SAM-dependent methyltransferase
METKEYKIVSEVQEDHWWWLGRQKIIEDLIQKKIPILNKLEIADVGCGYGANISMLKKYGHVTGLDTSKEAIDSIKKRWGGEVDTLIWQSPEDISKRFDFIVLADVLEHIPDDEATVNWIFRHLKEGGYILATVPAHRFFWTQMDVVVHHCRRYDRSELINLFKYPFKIIHFSFYNFILYPVKVGFLVFDRIKRWLFPKCELRSYNDIPPPPINWLFRKILFLESPFVKRFSVPYGISMILLAQRPDNLKE